MKIKAPIFWLAAGLSLFLQPLLAATPLDLQVRIEPGLPLPAGADARLVATIRNTASASVVASFQLVSASGNSDLGSECFRARTIAPVARPGCPGAPVVNGNCQTSFSSIHCVDTAAIAPGESLVCEYDLARSGGACPPARVTALVSAYGIASPSVFREVEITFGAPQPAPINALSPQGSAAMAIALAIAGMLAMFGRSRFSR